MAPQRRTAAADQIVALQVVLVAWEAVLGGVIAAAIEGPIVGRQAAADETAEVEASADAEAAAAEGSEMTFRAYSVAGRAAHLAPGTSCRFDTVHQRPRSCYCPATRAALS